jgi:hypothetical protein
LSAITINPEFDPETMSWFWDEYEAPTLRELQALLGPNVVIADYYPRGINIEIRDLRLTREQVLWHFARDVRLGKRSKSDQPTLPASPRPAPDFGRGAPRPHTRRHDHEAIIRMRARGMTYSAIARAIPTNPTTQVVYNICLKARAAGDKRALPGNHARGRAPSHQRSENDAHQAS